MKSIPFFLIAVLFVSVSAQAAGLYEWKDDKGVVNFTDNPANIPAKYRDRVRKRPSIDVKTGETACPPPRAPAEGARGATVTLYGGQDENWWRFEFGKLRDEKKNLEDALPAKRDSLEQARRQMAIYTYPRNRQAYYDLLHEIEGDEARILELNSQLEKLDNEASKAAVPFDWRK